ncbi:MAG TPA: iron-only hydrogenase system regulator [Clostridiales bacterium]|nr:iron-only hydrogenase system regulator [Clostridiales bacterium]
METRVALIGIILEKTENTDKLNAILHHYAGYIVSRMGVPYREKQINIMSVAVDAPLDVINAISGKIGRIDGVSVKTIYAQV